MDLEVLMSPNCPIEITLSNFCYPNLILLSRKIRKWSSKHSFRKSGKVIFDMYFRKSGNVIFSEKRKSKKKGAKAQRPGQPGTFEMDGMIYDRF